MLETFDFRHHIDKSEYQQVFGELFAALGECQRSSRAAGVPVILVFEGWDAAGKGTLLNRVTQALDPRGFTLQAIKTSTQDERFHPMLWRYWIRLPGNGHWALFDRSWYGQLLTDRLHGELSAEGLEKGLADVVQFERQLAEAGAVIVKFWLQISKHEQKRRFKRLLAKTATAWKVGPAEREQHRHYEKWCHTADHIICQTGSSTAPWKVINATQRRFTRVAVFREILDAVSAAIQTKQLRVAQPTAKQAATLQTSVTGKPYVAPDMSHATLDKETYEHELGQLQKRLRKLEFELYRARLAAVICYEGWDAAGKGGNIARLTHGLDPRGYEVVPIAAPTAEEKAHHYLWRFWLRVPKAGHITIFDRTWYGRVLVERVEGFCSEAEWRRAYDEINQFELDLLEGNTLLVKFWLEVDPDEQLRRFQDRQKTPDKNWKITDEDWRNREKRPLYERAVADMLELTSTPQAPWTSLESNCKRYARIKALRTVERVLEEGLAKGRR